MLDYGELCLLEAMGKSHTECGVVQSGDKNKRCDHSFYKKSGIAMWHAGGNWGDLWRIVQTRRLETFRFMKAQNMTIVSMPQSYHYMNAAVEAKDASLINTYLAAGFELKLAWRQQDGFDTALKMYPKAHHILSPDVAFFIGPIVNTRAFTKDSINNVDILFVLRADKESRLHGETKTHLIFFS